MSRKLGEHKHLWLLAVLLVGQIAQPLMGHESVLARIFSAAVILAVAWAVFWKLLEPGRERLIGALLILPAIVVEFAHYAFSDGVQLACAAVFHLSLAAFLVFAVAVILRHLFHKKSLVLDDVLGAFSGYMMMAIIFGNMYALVWLFAPDAFTIDSHILWQLSEWHTRRGLFAYFSFATLASVGYGDIVTTAPASNTLVWLEVMFGQFYMAVVVATIVGTRISRALAPKATDEA
jgi:hypothetical protein